MTYLKLLNADGTSPHQADGDRAVTAQARRAKPCVRCGTEPRHEETYLGAECRVGGEYQDETRRALTADPEHPRLWLKQHGGWYGGWGRVDR